ncbi:hypothetical protein [Clostridium felsineum]|uniref:Uncharacterized protein n=1 Tax=Clostridium felsineum TaxID=36839 RepID=A0A1S8L0I8_9CLOT|nr:hypothetical protein [Clostridium felsineum]URZ06466.1 hypothetical protein CLROS_017990 [Clostridium felsineum]URZ11501.1 hypothetical protein CROST_022180 [Clostridium felsineum]
MIKSIEGLGFKGEYLKMIFFMESVFNMNVAKMGSEETMLGWINKNLENAKERTEGLTDREKFIIAFTVLQTKLVE